jgi:starch-binding outer membrane protein, SusD/RagB family
MKKIKYIYAIALTLFLAQGCKKDLLEVENKNQPDFEKVFSNGEALQNLTSGLYNTIFIGEHAANGAEAMMATAADHVSLSWGNFGVRDMSWEPRNNAWNNSPSYSYNIQTRHLWDNMYSAINTASDVIKAMEGGVQVGTDGANDARTRAFCKFAQGVGYGNLALVFDKSFIVDEKSVAPEASLEAAAPYTEVAAAALKYLDEAATLAAGTAFTIPASWLGADHDYSSAEFKALISTYSARFLAYTPRNKTQLAAVNWAKVKTYADAGVSADFNVVMDAYAKWYYEAGDYLVYQGWGVTDNTGQIPLLFPIPLPQQILWTNG